jgi:hypothetical protein
VSILDRITKASKQETFIKAFLWGRSGSGKSTICGTSKKPILFAYNELPSLRAFRTFAPDEDTVQIKTMEDLRELLKYLREEKHSYQTVCLDSLTEMQQLLIDEVTARKRKADNTSEDELVELGWTERGFIHDASRNFIRAFRSLPMHVIMTCLSERVTKKDKEGKVVSDVTKIMLSGQKLPEQMASFFNVVGYCYKIPSDNGAKHLVLFEGRRDIDTKGLPGLRPKEEPDIEYWIQRSFHGAEPRDSEAEMIAKPSRRWPVSVESKPGNLNGGATRGAETSTAPSKGGDKGKSKKR